MSSGGGEPSRSGGGPGPCFPAAGEPGGLAVPGGGPGAGAGWLLGCLWAACAGRGSRLLAGGPAFAWLSNWVWMIPIAMLGYVFLLFPAGRLRSRRWRPAAWVVGGASTVAAVALLVHATRFWADPFGPASRDGSPVVLAAIVTLVVAALGVSVAA